MYFFSENYSAARKKFHKTCRQADFKVESHINFQAKAPTADELAMDVVWCGSENATKVMLVTCGTHGLEAAPGAATILKWIEGGAHQCLPDDTAVMIVHGVNPYGWAWSSRTNEDNVDINRNFLDHNSPYPENSSYGVLHELVINDDVSSHGLEISIQKFHEYSQLHGANAAIHGLSGGQFTNRHGISYGGAAPSWSYTTLTKAVCEKLVFAKKVAIIDWHTGIGDFSEPFIILEGEKHGEQFSRAASWWGEKYVHRDDIFGSAGSPDYSGLLIQGLQKEIKALNNADVLSVVIEFGTYGLDSMLQALFIDRWLRSQAADSESIENTALKTRLIERFYPSLPEWRHAILKHSERIYSQTLSGLENW